MGGFSADFVNCIISASNLTNQNHKYLRYVSIKAVDDSYEICGTNGFALALYRVKSDTNDFIKGYADLSNVRFPKKSVIKTAFITKESESIYLTVNLNVGKKTEQVLIPIIQNVDYPDYSKITNKIDKNSKTNSHYGEFLIYPNDILKALNVINTKHVSTVGLIPTEAFSFDVIKDNGIECVVYLDQSGERTNLSKIGTLNIKAITKYRDNPKINSPKLFDPELLKLVFEEAKAMCDSSVTFYLSSSAVAAQLNGKSNNSNVDLEYLIMPVGNN